MIEKIIKYFNDKNIFVGLFAAALVIITSIPYILGLVLPFPESRFNGILVFPTDHNFYFALMRQAQQGQWLFHNPFTPEAHRAIFFNLEWLVLGKFSALTGMPLELVWHLQRTIAIVAFCFVIYWALTQVYKTQLMCKIVFTVIMLGGGLAWVRIIKPFGSLLPWHLCKDTYAFIHPFYIMLASSHTLLGLLFSWVSLCLFIEAEKNKKLKYYIAAGICALLVGCIRPYDMIFIMGSIMLYMWILMLMQRETGSWQNIKKRMLPVLIPIPVIIYYMWVFHGNPVFHAWHEQAVTAPFSLITMGFSIGLPMLLLALSIHTIGNFSQKSLPQILITSSLLACCILIYSNPEIKFSFQLVSLLLIPIVIVATMAQEDFLVTQYRQKQIVRVLMAIFIMVNSLSMVWIYRTKIQEIMQGLYRTDRNLLVAYEWLEKHSASRDVVLPSSVYPIGNQIPRYTHCSVFCGYHYVTVAFREKKAMLEEFFQKDTSDTYRTDVLKKYSVHYVFVDTNDIKPAMFAPADRVYLKEVYHNPRAIIYSVLPQ
ncbi:MAG: hypothetical protein GF397_05940 [Elusimicrobia bacterium]|nr:hypothetical protein [Elusimicrobiota bacterium]